MPNTENDILQDGIPEITLELEVQQTVQAPIDTTLSISGQAADAAAVGQALSSLETTLTGLFESLFPVGCVYATTSESAPAFYGTWVEILMPATWGDIEDGTRSYADIAEGQTPGTLHFWRRIEDPEE